MIASPSIVNSEARLAAATSEAGPRTSKMPAALTAIPGGVLDGGEIILLAVKPSMWRPLFESSPWLVTACLLSAVLAGWGRSLPALSVSATAQFVLLLGLARLGVAVIRWVPMWYVLTNRRVIDIRGVRSPRIASRLLVDIRNTYLQSAPLERLARLGTITFVTQDDAAVPLAWHSIACPHAVHQKIRRAIEDALDLHGV